MNGSSNIIILRDDSKIIVEGKQIVIVCLTLNLNCYVFKLVPNLN